MTGICWLLVVFVLVLPVVCMGEPGSGQPGFVIESSRRVYWVVAKIVSVESVTGPHEYDTNLGFEVLQQKLLEAPDHHQGKLEEFFCSNTLGKEKFSRLGLGAVVRGRVHPESTFPEEDNCRNRFWLEGVVHAEPDLYAGPGRRVPEVPLVVDDYYISETRYKGVAAKMGAAFNPQDMKAMWGHSRGYLDEATEQVFKNICFGEEILIWVNGSAIAPRPTNCELQVSEYPDALVADFTCESRAGVSPQWHSKYWTVPVPGKQVYFKLNNP